VLGMVSVIWYAAGTHEISENEIEEQARREQEQKDSRIAWIRGVFKK